MKHNLCITIDEEMQETEEDIQLNAITQELQRFKGCFTPSCSDMNSFRLTEERNLLVEKNNSYLTQLLHYMESENYRTDYSYSIMSQVPDIAAIAKSLFMSRQACDQLLQSDLSSEWKLIKLITEDQKHKNNQIDLNKALKRNNRYSDMLPYKFNYVPYQTNKSYMKENQEEWYINASNIDGPFQEDEKAFIATQGPMQNTTDKFWRLCFNQDVKLLIMLCSFEEEGRKKCEYYLPHLNQSLHYEEQNMTVTLENEEWIIAGCLIKRELVITLNGLSKRLFHLQMLNWPDYSAPDKNGYVTIDYIIKLIAEFRQQYPHSPVLTHCSAGTGRTGTLIAIFNLIKCLSFFKNINNDSSIPPFLSVFNMVRKLREQRPGMVSTLEQYKYIYSHLFNWTSMNFELKE